jgi:hypothetical protein
MLADNDPVFALDTVLAPALDPQECWALLANS